MLGEVLKKIAEKLNNENIPYIVIGGQAALLYREPRFTNDIDITLGIGPDSLGHIIRICSEIGFIILTSQPNEFVNETMVLPVADRGSNTRIDFIFSNLEFEHEAINRSNVVDFDGIPINFCSLEDLIIMKIFSGRARDIDDVKYILLKNPYYDRELITNTLAQLGKLIDADLLGRYLEISDKA